MTGLSVEIWCHLVKDADGYPNQEWEQLHAFETAGGFRLANVPFFAKELAFGDVVVAHSDDRGRLVFDHALRRSGHSTFRVWLTADSSRRAFEIMGDIRGLGGPTEFTLDRPI